jgi:hypothetical protein
VEVKPGYKQTEVGVIPEEWDVSPVRQMGEVVTGKALAVNGPGQQFPYLRTKNVFDGRIDIADVLTMPMTDDQFAYFRLRHDDVLLNEGQSLELVARAICGGSEVKEEIARRAESLFALANESTTRLTVARRQVNAQTSSPLARAFVGRFVWAKGQTMVSFVCPPITST